MVRHRPVVWTIWVAVVVTLLGAPALRAASAESDRLTRAKDLIGDEQWVPAIQELKAAVADPAERNRDEALFWLAQCESQARDTAAAVATIQQLERDFPRSALGEAGALASRRTRAAAAAQRRAVVHRGAASSTAAAPPAAPPAPAAPTGACPRATHARSGSTAAATAGVDARKGYLPDMDLRIQALGSLMHTDALRVIPMLKEIALERRHARTNRGARCSCSRSRAARTRAPPCSKWRRPGPNPCALPRFASSGGSAVRRSSDDLLQVYATANERVKYQVVTALGQRDAAPALMRIAQSEVDRRLRDVAIVTLGEAGGREQLSMLYVGTGGFRRREAADHRRPVQCAGRRRADSDRRAASTTRKAREEVLARLRLLGTPKAKRTSTHPQITAPRR